MGIVNILPSEISNKIAAGEVVERPASVVKELVENSIDAGASTITVEIAKGGSTYIRVADNGCGMDPDDAKICFLRHATSKIKNEDDLDAIYTLGFRGEALSSIGAVARVSLYTRKKDGSGICVKCEGGEIISSEEAGLRHGTSVIVEDLFFNTPARAKFLKKDSTEAGYITDIMSRFIFAHPEISFRLIINGKEKLFSPGDNNLKNAVCTVYGRDYAENLIPVNYDNDGVKVSGMIGNGSVSRPNRSHESFFVNSRYVKSPKLMNALEEAFKNQIMIGKFPLAVLNIEINPIFIDINVHPTKLEVKFSDDRKVYQTVYYGVKNALYAIPEPENNLEKASDFLGIPTDMLRRPASPDFNPRENPFLKKQNGDTKTYQLPGRTFKENFKNILREPEKQFVADPASAHLVSFEKDPSAPTVGSGILTATGEKREEPEMLQSDSVILQYRRKAAKISEKQKAPENGAQNTDAAADRDTNTMLASERLDSSDSVSSNNTPIGIGDTKPEHTADGDTDTSDELFDYFRIAGQIFDTYIIAEQDGEMLIIDQHAAHERLKYEELLNELDNMGIYSQMLIEPVEISLSGAEAGNYSYAEDELKKLGFDCREENGTVFVSAIPQDIDMSETEDLLIELITQFGEGRNELISDTRQRLLYTVACKAAVKANHRLSQAEMESLVRNVLRLERSRKDTCPHGRPMIIRKTKKEIEKDFKRIV